jgi:hypothetical protein
LFASNAACHAASLLYFTTDSFLKRLQVFQMPGRTHAQLWAYLWT